MHLPYPTRLLVEEVIPPFGVPESLLSDRGTKMLCKMLGIEKLNNTAYHPQCDGAVEKFNRTLKTALGSRGSQWDLRNTRHCSTGEKPSFLLYGIDCRSPTEAAYPPTSEIIPVDVTTERN